MFLRWTIVIIAIVLAFLFPAWLIDAIRETDEKKARDARGKACAGFGFLFMFLLLILS